MMLMLAFHVLTHILYIDISSIEDIPVEIMVIGGIMFLFGNFRAFFLIISSSVNMISMQGNLRKGISPIKVWLKQMFVGVLLILIGMAGQATFDLHGVFGYTYRFAGSSIFDPNWDYTIQPEGLERYRRLNYIETIHTIGWSIVLTSVIHLILVVIRNGKEKTNRNALVYGLIGVAVLILTPYMLPIVEAYWGVPFVYWGRGQYQFIGWDTWAEWKDGLLRILCGVAVGEIQPMFPFFASACIGSILGLYLSEKDQTKKVPNRGMLAGGILILTGISIFIVDPSQFMRLIERQIFVHPIWFFLIITGLELILICFILRIREFNPRTNMKKYTERTIFFRRWGLIALSLFSFQIWPEFIARDLLTWMSTLNFHSKRQVTSLFATICLMIIVLFVWDLIIRLWERIQFVGSLEWMMSLISVRLINRETRGRLRIHTILYEPESVAYVIRK